MSSTERLRSLLSVTGLPDTPWTDHRRLYRRGNGRKLHSRHPWRSLQTGCGLSVSDLTEVKVTYLDSHDTCARCNDPDFTAAHSYMWLLEATATALERLQAPATGDAAEVARLTAAATALRNKQTHLVRVQREYPGAAEEWAARRDALEAEANARLSGLRWRLAGRPTGPARLRLVATQAARPTVDGPALADPWAGSQLDAATAWMTARVAGASLRSQVEAVYRKLSSPARRDDVTGLVTDPVLSGGRFRTPDEWARAELRAGARRYATRLVRHWEAAVATIDAQVDGPLRYVAFDRLHGADDGDYVPDAGYDQPLLAVLLAGAPVVRCDDTYAGIAAVDPVTAAYMTRSHGSYQQVAIDLGAADEDPGARASVMAEFVTRWSPPNSLWHGSFRDACEALAVARAVTGD